MRNVHHTHRRYWVLLALPAALSTGCIVDGPIDDDGLGWIGGGGGRPEGGTATPGDAGAALYPNDVAVEPGSGDLVVLGSNWIASGSSVALVDRLSGDTVRRWELPFWSMSIGSVSPGEVFLSDGSWNHYTLVLGTGEFRRVTGMDALADRTAAYVDGGAGGDISTGGQGDVVTLECEPTVGSPIAIWSGTGDHRDLVSATPLAESLWHVDGVAYAPERDLVFVLTMNDAIRGISLETGRTVSVVAELGGGIGAVGLAWDAAAGKVLTVRPDSTEYGRWTIAEY